MNPNKPKGFSVERLLNDPMAMFGALGGMGALVVTVWMVAGSPSTKDEDGVAGGFQSAPTKSAASGKSVGEVGSSLKVAKLKDPTAGKGVGGEGLKDAHGSASAGSDGFLRGTLSEIEAAEKAKAADAAKSIETTAVQATAGKKSIPTEVAGGGGHVPGSAPDSTKLAAMAKGNFGSAPNLNNSDFAGGVGAGGGASGSAGFAAGSPTSPDLGESGPLVAGNMTVPGKASVGGSRQFARGQAGSSGAGPAGAGAVRRAAGGIGAGGASGGAASGAGPDFSSGGTSFSPGGSSGGGSSNGSSSASADALPAAGGGAPKTGGGGGAPGMGLRGATGQASDNLQGGQKRSVTQATKTELKEQARKHYEAAQTYRTGVVVPLTQRETRHATVLGVKLAAASTILKSLDGQLKTEQNFFRSYPAALGPLANSRALIANGAESLKGRIDSAATEMKEGAERVAWVPDKCNFHPTVHDKVFHEGFRWGKPQVVENGQHGWYEDRPRQIDINGVATSGQDMLESAARRAANVRQESGAGIKMVDPEFNPAIQTVTAANAAAGARLAAIAARIKDDLKRVAAQLPEHVNETVAAESSNQGKLQASAMRGHEDIKALANTVNERRLGYPDGTARDRLDRNMADASRDSGEALGASNALTGTSSDTMFVLTEASRGATSALQSLCYSGDRLTELSAKGK